MMNSSVFARSTIRSRVLTRPMRGGAYHWENVDGSVSSYLLSYSIIFPSTISIILIIFVSIVYKIRIVFIYY